ncbi:redoxin domain-containing protein, partial [Bacillus pumilus]|uniref:redoxin domain-containing protein n=1 Tax=Bacillus pumilus TaxID=1408 RepID=UPI0034D976A5
MQAVLPNNEFRKLTLQQNINNHKSTLLFFYPIHFTFLSPTQITPMTHPYHHFQHLHPQIIPLSTHTIHTHLPSINTHPKDNRLRQFKYPLPP